MPRGLIRVFFTKNSLTMVIEEVRLLTASIDGNFGMAMENLQRVVLVFGVVLVIWV